MTDVIVRAAATKRVFHSLDGLRGVAALAVVSYHLGAYLGPFEAHSAYLAVDLFFVISGFVLAHAYGAALRQSLGVTRFFTLRLVRLYPLYLVGAVLGMVVPVMGTILHISHVWTWPILTAAVAPTLLMLPTPPLVAPSMLYFFDSPAWSLLFELGVNIAFAALSNVSRRAAAMAVGAAALGLLATGVARGSLDGGWLWSTWWVGLLRVSFSFGIGVALFRLHGAVRGRGPRVPPLLLLTVAAVLLSLSPSAPWRAAYDVACVMFAFPLLVWLCAVNDPSRGKALCAWLGLISYPIYLLNVPARDLMDHVVLPRLGRDPALLAPWAGLAMAAILMVAAWWLARRYDPWARQRLGGWLGLRVPSVV